MGMDLYIMRYKNRRTPNEISEIDKLAVRYFGTTKNFKIGGYIK